ncbi:MAG: hypothetical protein PHR69_02055 [Sphaerochaeta sp.]|nr:hypothetical protein [Sphaerochaeta sp.]
MERTALIYYSLDGHTHFIAEKFGKHLDCPIIRLKLKQEFSTKNKFFKYFWAGKSSAFHDKPALANAPIDLEAYDTLIIATPVWAGNLSSPVRSFLATSAVDNKQVYLIATNSGGSFGKCFATMRRLLPTSTIRGQIGFVEVDEETYPTHKERLEAFCAEILAGK